MTDIDIEAIEKREQAASNGMRGWKQVEQNKSIIVGDGCGEIARASERYMDRAEREANAAFIEHAFTDVPALIAEVRRLRAKVAAGDALAEAAARAEIVLRSNGDDGETVLTKPLAAYREVKP